METLRWILSHIIVPIVIFAGIILALSAIPAGAEYVIYSDSPDIVSLVMHKADFLSENYGHRPPYNGPKFALGERLSQDEAISVAPYVLACESRNKTVGCIVDSNGKLSCGPAQFQDWKEFWEPTLHVYGDPNSKPIATKALIKGLEMGYIGQWSCSKILKIVDPRTRNNTVSTPRN